MQIRKVNEEGLGRGRRVSPGSRLPRSLDPLRATERLLAVQRDTGGHTESIGSLSNGDGNENATKQ